MFTGLSFIGARRSAPTGVIFYGLNPVTGEALPGSYHSATLEEAHQAADLAAAAFPAYSHTTSSARAVFLRTIATNIEALGPPLFDRVMAESALPEARVKGETTRTCGQLRFFASVIEEGSWVDARIDHGDAARQPMPKPDLRAMLRPIGPVVVFGASNFPLAYSVAGGDTASALAAGCPVIVKAHSAHPGTAELVAGAVRDAAVSCGMPEGTFSMVFDNKRLAAQALVKHPGIRGVGFTGSRAGGRALMDAAAARLEPIPVYAEMSSVNPVYLLAGAINERGAALAAGLHASATMGVGQFCTNPGIVLFDCSADSSTFKQELARLMGAAACGTMLTEGICRAYNEGYDRLKMHPDVSVLASAHADSKNAGTPAVFETTAAAILADRTLTEEVFGPCTLLVSCNGMSEMIALTESFEGQLTATIHGTDSDLSAATNLIHAVERRAGRLVCNGFPTGVEVNHAIVHGGPYPATSDGRSTSVGSSAILRWVRPIAWQDYPDHALPLALQEANPAHIWRLVDGQKIR